MCGDSCQRNFILSFVSRSQGKGARFRLKLHVSEATTSAR
jgi:hypothetical protein